MVRQVEKTENQTTGNWETDEEVVHVYDGWNRIATFEPQGSSLSLQTSYLWGIDLSGSMQGAGGVGGLLKEGDLHATYDANGNIMQKLHGTGAVVMSVDYDPFGNIVEGTFVGEYGFSTKPLIRDIDWYYYGFRYYDPVTGRWPSRDPIGENGGINLYGMVGNNPVNRLDLLGLVDCCGDEELQSGNVCCDGTQHRRQKRKACCGSDYITMGPNQGCRGGSAYDRGENAA